MSLEAIALCYCFIEKFHYNNLSLPLVVGVPPSFTQNGEPQDIVVSTEIFNSAGEVMANLVLPCGVTGDPTPTVTWYRGDTVLPSQFVTSDGSLVMNVTEGVDASRSGVLYHCEASNVFGGNGSPAILII